ncbi:uncharacterized protein F4807DRAFT_428201, partial [Annulohypoxylon truncatum]|uniref:uncharacterized protein n=1 Tax=Annulohypoxylon truncatum TaxID=327061 RepID=UPI002008BE9D
MEEDAFEILLVDANDDAAHYRLQNEPGEIQREYVTGYDRKSTLRVLGRLADVVHGRSSPPSSDLDSTPCTLAIFEFAALGQKPSRRYREVQIEIVFRAYGTHKRPNSISRHRDQRAALSRYDPAIRALAPHGHKSLLQSNFTRSSTHNIEASISAGTDPIASAGAKYAYALSENVERGDSMTVEGTPSFVGRSAGKPNAARFTLRENGTQRSGVPRHLRVAVLLERRAGDDEGLFLAEVNVRAHVSVLADAGERVRRVMGSVPLDDAVCFDPAARPTTDKYPVDRLAEVVLSEECSIRSGREEDFSEKKDGGDSN